MQNTYLTIVHCYWYKTCTIVMASINGDPIKRLDVPNPFFLSRKPFNCFDDSDYNWEEEGKISLLVKYSNQELQESPKLTL